MQDEPSKGKNNRMKMRGRLSEEDLANAIKTESKQFKEYYLWLEKHMPPQFFEEFERAQVMTIAHNLMGFNLQDNFIQIDFGSTSISARVRF